MKTWSMTDANGLTVTVDVDADPDDPYVALMVCHGALDVVSALSRQQAVSVATALLRASEEMP